MKIGEEKKFELNGEKKEVMCQKATVGCKGCIFAQSEKGGERSFQCDKFTDGELGKCTKEDRLEEEGKESIIFKEIIELEGDDMAIGEERNGYRCEEAKFLCEGCAFNKENTYCNIESKGLGKCQGRIFVRVEAENEK